MVVDHPRKESVFEVPAFVAGNPQLRNFARVFPGEANPFRTELTVYNGSPATIIIRLSDGDVRRVREADFLVISGHDVYWYTVDASVDVADDQVEVFEGWEEEDGE